MTRLPTYNGGKSGNGTYHTLINHTPVHRVFVTLFAGHCGLFQNIKRAELSIINDIDTKIVDRWGKVTNNDARVKIRNQDAIEALQSKQIAGVDLDRPGVFIYLDPPYLPETIRSTRPLYDHLLSRYDHLRLLSAVCNYEQAMIMISHYPCETYDRSHMGCTWSHVDYQNTTRQGKATERIYFNYPVPTKLHDYSCIGNDWRHREKLTRAKNNMVAKLKRLDPLLLNAILADISPGA